MACFFINSSKKGRRGKHKLDKVFCQRHLNGSSSDSTKAKTKKKVNKEVKRVKKDQNISSPKIVKTTNNVSKKLCNAFRCICPNGHNFYNSQVWKLKFCHLCQKVSAHNFCAGKTNKWTCPWCKNIKNKTKTVKKANVKNDNHTDKREIVTKRKQSPIKSMKKLFCSEITLSKLKAKRSPLIPKQKDQAKTSLIKYKNNDNWKITAKELFNGQLKLGKENKKVKGHKGVKRDKWIVNKDLKKSKKKRGQSQGQSQSSASSKVEVKKKKKTALTLSGESSPAKKFADNHCNPSQIKSKKKKLAFNSQSKLCDKKSTVSPKKIQKKPKKKDLKALVKTINVEPKDIKDRQLFHVQNSIPIQNHEVEAEEDYQWLVDAANRQIDDFLDLNDGEKAFYKLWNTHMHFNPCFGDVMMVQILEKFIDERGTQIWKYNLYKNFLLHLTNFYEFGILDQVTILQMIRRLQMQFVKNSSSSSNQFLTQSCDDLDETNTALTLFREPLERSPSRCSTPVEDGASVTSSSNQSLKLYLSESDEEDESSRSSFSMKLRGNRNNVQNVRRSNRNKGDKYEMCSVTCDRPVHSISDLPSIDNSSGSPTTCSTVLYQSDKRTRRASGALRGGRLVLANGGGRRPVLMANQGSQVEQTGKRLIKVVRRGDGNRRNWALV